jgi:nicotinate phosphoribosyltransferase
VKLSEQAIKISTPGIHQVRRFSREGVLLGDMIWDVAAGAEPSHTAIDPMDGTKRVTYDPDVTHEDLLVPIYRGGAAGVRSPLAARLPRPRLRAARRAAAAHASL